MKLGLTRRALHFPIIVLASCVVASCGGATEPETGVSLGGGSSGHLGGSTGMPMNQGGSGNQGAGVGYGGTTGTIAVGGSPGYCPYNGVSYAVGEAFVAPDGCNTCYCLGSGAINCTADSCGSCIVSGQAVYVDSIVVAGSGCDSCTCTASGPICKAVPCPSSCLYNGVSVELGETVPAGDGCNSCSCDSTGNLSCTKMACFNSCSYAGKMYADQSTFLATDGCNKCTCSAGRVPCTEIFCGCAPTVQYWRSYASTSPLQCLLLDYVCQSGTAPFSNTCGCGCEQNRECPEAFPCVTTPAAGTAVGSGTAPAAGSGVAASSSNTATAAQPILIMPPPCATPAEQAQCPLTPVETYLL